MRFEFEAHGEVLISRDLLRFGERAVQARPLFDEMADYLMKHEKKVFDSAGSAGGVKWPPLAESTVAMKAKKGLDPRILHATLALRNSLTQRGAKGQNLVVSDDELVFGSTLPYALFHTTGTSRMPARPPIRFTEVVKRRLAKAVQGFLADGRVKI